MGSQTNITVLNILNWPEELVAKNIELAVIEIKRMIMSVDDNKIEYIVFAFENVIQHIPISSVEETLLYPLCCAVEEIYLTTLEGLESNLESSIKLTQFDSKEASLFLLIICNRIIHSLRVCCENLCKMSKIECNQIRKFIDCSKLILIESFDYYNRNYNIVTELMDEFFSGLSQFNSHFWKLITQVVNFDSNRNEDTRLLGNLLCTLETDAKNSFSKPKLQIAECWKNLINLIDKNHNNIGIENIIKFDHIISYLCSYLIKELVNIESNNGECDVNQFQSFKIYNFLLKITVKICKTYKQKLKECFTDLISLLLILFRMSPTFLRSNNFEQAAVSEINRQVIMASDPLLSVVYNNSEFVYALKVMLEKNLIENPYGCTMILITLLKKVNNAGMKELYYSSTFDIMEYIFISYGFCHNGLIGEKFYAPGTAVTQIEVKKDLYDYVFSALAVFTLTLSSVEFSLAENNFLKNTLQDNPWKAILASDLWCLVARYANVQVCHRTLDTLIACISKIDLNTARPEFTHLLCLVRRLIQFCEPQYLNMIVQNYPLDNNILLWKNIGTLANKSYNVIVRQLTIKLKYWIDHDDNTIDDFKYLEACLDALAAFSGSNELDSVVNLMHCLWSVESFSETSPVWINYLCSLTSITTTIIKKMEPHQISMIIQRISRIQKRKSHKVPIVEQFCFFLLVKSLFNTLHQFHVVQQSDIRQISSVFYSVLTSESSMVSTMSMFLFSDFAYNPNFSQIIEHIGCDNEKLQNELANFIQKDFPGQCKEANITRFFPLHYDHDCSSIRNNSSIICQNGSKNRQMNRVHPDAVYDETLDRLERDCTFLVKEEAFLSSTHILRIKSLLTTLNQIDL